MQGTEVHKPPKVALQFGTLDSGLGFLTPAKGYYTLTVLLKPNCKPWCSVANTKC